MLINNTHIADALSIPWNQSSNIATIVCKHVKVTRAIPSNNKVIKYAHVNHFDLDEAIEAMSSIRATKVRLRILAQLREVKARLSL